MTATSLEDSQEELPYPSRRLPICGKVDICAGAIRHDVVFDGLDLKDERQRFSAAKSCTTCGDVFV